MEKVYILVLAPYFLCINVLNISKTHSLNIIEKIVRKLEKYTFWFLLLIIDLAGLSIFQEHASYCPPFKMKYNERNEQTKRTNISSTTKKDG